MIVSYDEYIEVCNQEDNDEGIASFTCANCNESSDTYGLLTPCCQAEFDIGGHADEFTLFCTRCDWYAPMSSGQKDAVCQHCKQKPWKGMTV